MIVNRKVRIVNVSKDNDPRGTDVYDLETDAKLLDVYRGTVTVDGEEYEVTRHRALPFPYEGIAR